MTDSLLPLGPTNMDIHTCGHYALLFLKAEAKHQSFQDWLVQWNSQKLVLNDRRAGQKIQRLIKTAH